MIDPLAAGIVRHLSRILPGLPRPAAAALTVPVGHVLSLLPIRRKLVEEQLEATGIAITPREKRRLWKAIIDHQCQNLLEFLRLPSLTRENLPERVTFSGLEHFDRAREAGRGAVLVTAHFGNWELMGAALGLAGYPLQMLVRRQSGQFDEAITRLREAPGNQVIDRVNSGRKIMRVLKQNGIVGMVSDQHTDNAGVPVTFLGRPCKATGAPVAFALKTGAPVIPGYSVRLGFERHHVHLLPPIGLEITGDSQRDIADGTLKYTRVIENFVRRHPELWFWFHRRWRD